MSLYKTHTHFEKVLVNANGYKRVDSGEKYEYGDGREFVPVGMNHQKTFMRIEFVEGGYDIVPVVRDTVNIVGVPGRRRKETHEYPSGVSEELIANAPM